MTARTLTGAAVFALACALTACSSQSATPQAAGQTSSVSIADNCIRPSRIERQTIVSDQEIRFDLRGGESWVNRLPNRCSGLRMEGGFAWDIHGDLACSNQELIHVLNSGITCQLGVFTKLPPEPA